MATTQQKVAIREHGAPVPRPVVGRGRKVQAAVFAATLGELAASGYADLSVETVALRAGVHKTTIYRRWPDRERLVAAALAHSVAQDVPTPDTGCLESDLRELARALVTWHTSPTGAAMFMALITAGEIPEVAAIKRQFFEDRMQRHQPLVRRAIDRDELAPDTDAAEVIKTLIAPIYLRLLITAEPIDETTADAATRVTLAAARAGALHSTSRVRSING